MAKFAIVLAIVVVVSCFEATSSAAVNPIMDPFSLLGLNMQKMMDPNYIASMQSSGPGTVSGAVMTSQVQNVMENGKLVPKVVTSYVMNNGGQVTKGTF